MCNIAGYVGCDRAAPILIEMLKNQEGFAGGYYSGIATLHEGKLYSAKVVGDVDRLLETTNALSLPGTVGIIHSRSKSGGGECWAHPFLSEKDGSAQSAYVANGSAGFFQDRLKDAKALAEELESKGYRFSSRTNNANGYVTFDNGESIHMSDLMAQLIRCHIDCGESSEIAMEKAFCEFPGEIVGLLLCASDEQSITWSRINMPMFLGFSDHGAYLASSSIAFPQNVTNETLLPCLASGKVYANSYTVIPYPKHPCNMKAIDDTILRSAYDVISECLKEGNKSFADLYRAIAPLFGVCECKDSEPLAYRILRALEHEGRLTRENRRVAGVYDKLTAPKTFFSFKKNI